MKNAKIVESVAKKLTVKGTLVDIDTIEFIDDDKEVQTLKVSDCIKKFVGEEISLSISTKSDNESDFPEDIENED